MIYIIIGGFAVLGFSAVLDDLNTRRVNQQLRQRLAMLNEDLEAADAQCVAYMETIARERQGKACGSKKECSKCG